MHKTPQWIITRRVPRPNGKTDKLPINWRTGKPGNAHDPAMWLPYAQALPLAPLFGADHGIGFVFTANDPYFFVDVDAAVVDGQWSDLAKQAVAQFPNAYREVSQSGKGLHIIGRYDVDRRPAHTMRNDALHLEFYTELRFADITGIHASGNPDADCHEAMTAWAARYHPPAEPALPGTPTEWTTGPCAEWRGPTDDDELIQRARRSRSAAAVFGGKAAFADLWDAKADVLAATYPADPNSQEPYNASSADAALAAHLMFWTGKDCERTERLMRRSCLLRDKWDDRSDYLRDRTIMHALRHSRDVLQDRPPEPPPGGVDAPTSGTAAAATTATGDAFTGIPQQAELFAGCVYVLGEHKVMLPKGDLITPDRFKSHIPFAGRTFVMDGRNERTSRDAWEAFSQNQVLRPAWAHGVMFRPDLEPGVIIEESGRKLVNTYYPLPVKRRKGDAGPFLAHVAKLLPDARDREILLSYMAACVQHRGIKFRWAPLLQGVPGNGKTTITECLVAAIGADHCSSPTTEQITSQFNGWLFNKQLVYVEDVYAPEQKRELLEILKPMITGDRLAKREMHKDLVMHNVCANFIFNSNHHDAIAKTRDDRRFCVFYTAQQEYDDLARDSMDGAYFKRLRDWLKDGGFEIVAEYLHTMPICDELNPATVCSRAPDTTSTAEAIVRSLGRVEQEIMEAVEQERPGFAGGWISSIALTALLKEINARIPINKRKDMLQALGYVHHPGLPNGRTFNVIMPDGGKPSLFIRQGHESMALTGGAAARAYSDAQAAASAAPALRVVG